MEKSISISGSTEISGREFDIIESLSFVFAVVLPVCVFAGAHYWHNRFVSNFLPRVKRILNIEVLKQQVHFHITAFHG